MWSSAPSRSTRTLFVNPGGPGVAADWLAPALAAHFPALHRSHVLLGGNACAVGRGTTYLINGRLPASDVVCRGRALPGDTTLHPTGATLTPAALRK